MNKIKKVLLVLTIISLSFFSTCCALGKSEYGTFRTKALLPKGFEIYLIEKLNDKEMFVQAFDKNIKSNYFVCDIETEECSKYKEDEELKGYRIWRVYEKNTLLVEDKNEKYSQKDEELGVHYLYNVKTKGFRRIAKELLAEGERIGIGNKKFLRIPDEDAPDVKNYYICSLETQKCEYGGKSPLRGCDGHLRLDDDQILIISYKTVVYNIKKDRFYDFETKFDILRIVNCGENLYCSFYVKDDIKQPEAFFGYGFEYGTIIDRYKFINNKFEYLGTVPTDLKTDGYQMFSSDPNLRFWFVYGGEYGYGRFNARSKAIHLVDTETGKTVKVGGLGFRKPNAEKIAKNKWIIYSEEDFSNKVVIFEANDRFAR